MSKTKMKKIKDFFKNIPTRAERDYLDIVITGERLKKNPHFVEETEKSVLSGHKVRFRRIRELLHLIPSDPYGDRDALLQDLRKFVKEQEEKEAYYRSLRRGGNKQASVNLQTIQSL